VILVTLLEYALKVTTNVPDDKTFTMDEPRIPCIEIPAISAALFKLVSVLINTVGVSAFLSNFWFITSSREDIASACTGLDKFAVQTPMSFAICPEGQLMAHIFPTKKHGSGPHTYAAV
jgi:hypothetical protein